MKRAPFDARVESLGDLVTVDLVGARRWSVAGTANGACTVNALDSATGAVMASAVLLAAGTFYLSGWADVPALRVQLVTSSPVTASGHVYTS